MILILFNGMSSIQKINKKIDKKKAKKNKEKNKT